VEAAYIGKVGVWWSANTLSVWASNPVTPQRLAAMGLDLNNPAGPSPRLCRAKEH